MRKERNQKNGSLLFKLRSNLDLSWANPEKSGDAKLKGPKGQPVAIFMEHKLRRLVLESELIQEGSRLTGTGYKTRCQFFIPIHLNSKPGEIRRRKATGTERSASCT